jgi:hypothetical protein
MLPSARPRSSSSPQPPKRKSWSPPPCSFRPPQSSHRIRTKKSASSLQSFTTISGNSSSDSSSPRRAIITHKRAPNSCETQSPALGQVRTRKSSSRTHSSASLSSSKFLFTPASTPPLVGPSYLHSPTYYPSNLPAKKSLSSPLLSSARPIYPTYSRPHIQDSEDDRDDEEMIFTSWSGSGSTTTQTAGNLRPRILGGANGHVSTRGGRDKPKSISTTPGLLGAGETETEADEPVSRLL